MSLNPECRAGKCSNCDGAAWDDRLDAEVPDSCSCEHHRPSPLPLHRTEANVGIVCGTCEGGGCPDCTDPA